LTLVLFIHFLTQLFPIILYIICIWGNQLVAILRTVVFGLCSCAQWNQWGEKHMKFSIHIWCLTRLHDKLVQQNIYLWLIVSSISSIDKFLIIFSMSKQLSALFLLSRANHLVAQQLLPVFIYFPLNYWLFLFTTLEDSFYFSSWTIIH
jgi:hypothetical protein